MFSLSYTTKAKARGFSLIRRVFYDALQYALIFRDQLIQRYGWPVNKPVKKGLRSNNTSGVSGVHHTKFTRKKNVNGRTYHYLVDNWVATWAENGQTKSKSFPISKYGYNRAYELALDYRIKKEEELLNNVKGDSYESKA